MEAEDMELDIAVVGGGVSGTYSAWRLQKEHGTAAKIGLFEYSDRIGGRLYTITLPGLPHVMAEVGGMRYIPSQHKLVANLVEHLELPTAKFAMKAQKNSVFYLRGKHLRLNELADPDKVPYNLAWSERGLGPDALLVQVMNSIYPDFDKLSLSDQMKVEAFGKPLWQHGFWDLMCRVLSNEGYEFMRDACGYDANVANANAVTQLSATEYSDDTEYLTLRHGYDQLPLKLEEQFRTFDGKLPADKRVFMQHRLTDIVDNPSNSTYRYTLIFERTITSPVKINGEDKKNDDGEIVKKAIVNTVKVKARKVILAMPRRSLELIKGDFFNKKYLRDNIPSVLIQSACKLFLAYERPWWHALGLTAGRTVTDLPVRQIYYFGTEAEQPEGKPYLNSLLMASYNDISTVPFWKELENGAVYKGYKPSCLKSDSKNIIQVTGYKVTGDMVKRDNELVADECVTGAYKVTEDMVALANKQVAEAHAIPQLPKPYSAVYHNWNDDPYGGGWHEWKANYKLDEIMQKMRKPVDEDDIFIVGEAYSFGQGWVEGALDTAESTLQEFFCLGWPAWLDNRAALLSKPLPPLHIC